MSFHSFNFSLLAIISLSLFIIGCNQTIKTPKADFNWDGSAVPAPYQDTVEKYFGQFPDGAQIAMAIIDGDDVDIIGLKRSQGQFDPVDNRNNYFEIGSITKTFTSALMSKLEYQNKLNRSDLLKDYIDVTLSPGDNDPNEIQLLHLSNHTSGLPRLPGNIMKDAIVHKNDPYKNYDGKRLKSFLSEELEISAKAGNKYLYSNLGAGLLGYILGEKFNSSYEELLIRELCLPLNMPNTSSELKKEPELIKGINAKGKKVPNWHFKALSGCGVLKSTLTDMITYTKKQLTDTTYLAQTHVPTHAIDSNQSVGLAWHINKYPFGNIIWHNGGTGGYTSCIAFDKKTQKAVVTLTNMSALAKQGIQTDQCTFALLKKIINQ